MSTSVASRPRSSVRARVVLAALGVVAGGLLGGRTALGTATAQPSAPAEPGATRDETADPSIDPAAEVGLMDALAGELTSYASAIVDAGHRWRGQRVPFPSLAARPDATLRARSEAWPVALHVAAPIDRDAERAWLAALDAAHVWLAHDGWPLPPPDGGRGGTDGLDVYLVPAIDETTEDADLVADELARDGWEAPRWSTVLADAPLLYPSFFSGAREGDGAVVHARARLDVAPELREACAVQLVAEAGLFAADPGEATTVRRATAAWLAWTYTGLPGCDADAFARQQAAPHRALLPHEPTHAEGGGLFIAALADRHGGGGTAFIRDLFSFAQQKTWDGELRGEPDFVRMVMQASGLAHDPLDRVVESFGAARALGARSELGAVRELGGAAPVPIAATAAWSALPRRVRELGPPLEPWGSAYVRVDVTSSIAGDVLRVWLDGETGTEWSLVAVRLDASGRERGRTRAPRTRRPRSYLPLELDGATREVLLVVTNIPDDDDPRTADVTASADSTPDPFLHRVGLDPDVLEPGPRGVWLTIDRGSASGAPQP